MEKKHFPYKMCIPYPDHARGGMYTFLSYFKDYLRKNNIAFTRNMLLRYDILFINSFMTMTRRYCNWIWFAKLRIAKLLYPDIFIVHRIDGSAQDYGRGVEWDQRQRRINRMADLTIFQSQYGRYATMEKFDVIVHDGPVIYNPVDTTLFKPYHENPLDSSRAKIAHISFSTNIKKGADQIFQVAHENHDIDFILIGKYKNQPDLKNIRFTGHLSREEVARILGTCHFFLFFSQNESCPNVVLEAMASGLPVLYLDSGGTAELVGDTGIAITTEAFREAFEKIWHNWHDWSKTTRARAENTFSVNKIIPEYLNAISVLKRQQ